MKRKSVQCTVIGLAFIFLSFFRLNLLKGAKGYFQQKLNRLTGILVHLEGVHLERLFQVVVERISLHYRAQFRVDIEGVTCTLMFVKRGTSGFVRFPVLRILVKQVRIGHSKSKSKGGPSSLTPGAVKHGFLWQKSCSPLLRKVLGILFKRPLPVLVIERLEMDQDMVEMARAVQVHALEYGSGRLAGTGKAVLHGFDCEVPFALHIDRKQRKILLHNQQKQVRISKGERQAATLSGYDIEFEQKEGGRYSVSGALQELVIDLPEFSGQPVRIQCLKSELNALLTSESFQILQDSSVSMDDIWGSLSLLHDAREPDLVKCSAAILLEGESFFQSYPFFLLEEMRSIRGEGSLILKLDYILSLSDLKRYYFKAQALTNSFRVKDFGRADFSFLQGAFQHHILLDGGKVRSLSLSEHNMGYRRLQDIPFILRQVITLTEDPNFYHHSGIDSHFIGIALATNLSQRKFVRGASTITMQLARNLFLHHAKTINRKLDEMIIAWLLEGSCQLSKERILEVYLNIIEFGDNVYGVKEAADFYFEKDLQELSIQECLVISYIIPRPKYFLDALLMQSPVLIQNLGRHVRYYAGLLLSGRHISQQEHDGISHVVSFKAGLGVLDLLTSPVTEKV